MEVLVISCDKQFTWIKKNSERIKWSGYLSTTSVYGDKKGGGDTFYFYKGISFKDQDGYELLMMAKHFPQENEIRLYSSHDIGNDHKGTQNKMVRINSKFNLRKVNSMRIDKINQIPFDYENGAVAKVYINSKANGSKEFVIKSRFC